MEHHRIPQEFNWTLLGIVMALVAIGLVNLYSAVYFWDEGGARGLFWNQLIWAGLGISLMIVASLIDYRIFHQLAPVAYAAVLVLLVATIFFGTEIHGARGWLRLGPMSLQPAEFAKLAYLLIAARYFSDHPEPDGYGFWELLRPLILMIVPFALIIAQKDMGSALFLICIFGTMAFFARVRRQTLIACVIMASVGAGGVYTFALKPYQRDRIVNFLHPEANLKGSGYQLMQSKIAVGSGKVFGKGYLKGNINKLRYLPERHTDFIFPVLAEEWGFAGCSVVLGLYAALLFMGVMVATKARDRFGHFLGIGVVAMIFWQVTINLGGVLGLMPLTGVTLPLLSYGGSSLVSILIGAGILLGISLRRFMF